MTTKQRREIWIYDNGEEPCLAFTEKPDPNDGDIWAEECDYAVEITNEEAVYNKADVEALVNAIRSEYEDYYSWIDEHGIAVTNEYTECIANLSKALERWEGK